MVRSIDVETAGRAAAGARGRRGQLGHRTRARCSRHVRRQRSLDVSLKRLEITDAVITFDDRQNDLRSRISGLQHSLSGDFGKQRFTLRTQTTADSVSLDFAGVPYLSSARVQVIADVDADMAAKTFTLRENSVRVNDLQLNAQGTVSAAPDNKT